MTQMTCILHDQWWYDLLKTYKMPVCLCATCFCDIKKRKNDCPISFQTRGFDVWSGTKELKLGNHYVKINNNKTKLKSN